LLTSVSSVSTLGNGRHHLRPPVIDRTVTADQSAQHQSPVAQEKTSPTQDVSAIVSTAKADTKKASITNVLARQHNNYRYGNALGYAEESGYGPRGLWFR